VHKHASVDGGRGVQHNYVRIISLATATACMRTAAGEKPAGCIFMISLISSAEIKIVENSLIGVPLRDSGILFHKTKNYHDP
jgi:hypothetical protein